MKLWHKYAIALFLAAVIPLAIAVWQIAGRGADEIKTGAMAYHVAIGDAGIAAVDALVDGALAEAKTVGAAIAMTNVPVEERVQAAQAHLQGATVISSYVVYTPAGEDVQRLEGVNRDARVVGGVVPPPVPLPEALREKAKADSFAFGDIIRRDDGALFLPLVVRIAKPDGSVYAYGWTPIDLAPLSAAMSTLSQRRFGDAGFVNLIDGQLHVIASSDAKRLWQPFGVSGETLGVSDPGELKRDRAHTFDYTTSGGEARFGSVTPVIDMGWGVVVEQPTEEVFVSVRRIWQTALFIGGGFALAALLFGIFAGRRLSAPISAVSAAAGKVAGGDFTVQVPVPGKDEVGQLATSFNAMTNQLTATIAQLQATTAAKERMQTELAIGHNIQMSMVPLTFPVRKEFDIHAALKPAFEVGGDFYDFFMTDDHTLCVCIADVSGKGVPAALFMAVTRTLVKAHASAGATSDEILDRVNDDLAKDNDACMFVTVFLGLIDLRTGQLAFTNAGHNPSYVKHMDSSVTRLDQLHGPVVAAIEDVPYASGTVALAKGDTLVLYTDGVNEAMNAKKELFTEERLAKLLATSPWTSADGAVKVVLDDVWAFQGAAEQADDVTVLAVRDLGPG